MKYIPPSCTHLFIGNASYLTNAIFKYFPQNLEYLHARSLSLNEIPKNLKFICLQYCSMKVDTLLGFLNGTEYLDVNVDMDKGHLEQLPSSIKFLTLCRFKAY